MRFLILTVLVGLVAAQDEEQVVNKEFLTGYNTFIGAVYNEIKKTTPGSFVVSPLSLDIVLSLAEYGSKGETSKQLAKALGLPENKSKLREAITSLTSKLNANDTYKLSCANKIYVKEGYQILETFKKFATDVYHAEVENINFENKVFAAESMNKWVGEKTLHKINNLISENDLNEDTYTILLNALYFNGEWITKFDKANTRKDTFYLDSNAKTEVDLMHVKDSFRYHENNKLNAKFLELPYVGLDITLTVVLPNDKDGLKDLENKIADVLDASYYKYESVIVKLPKLKIESKIEFKSILQSLGVNNAFEDNAEFPEISEKKLKISKVVQKALIEIDEEGTTAAAATAVFIDLIRSSLDEPRKPKEFIADHPFIFVLKYKSVVLFVGHYTGQ